MPPTRSPTNRMLTGATSTEDASWARLAAGPSTAAASGSAILCRWLQASEGSPREHSRGGPDERAGARFGRTPAASDTPPGAGPPLGPARPAPARAAGAVGPGPRGRESAVDLHRCGAHRSDPQSGRRLAPAPAPSPRPGSARRISRILPDAVRYRLPAG